MADALQLFKRDQQAQDTTFRWQYVRENALRTGKPRSSNINSSSFARNKNRSVKSIVRKAMGIANKESDSNMLLTIYKAILDDTEPDDVLTTSKLNEIKSYWRGELLKMRGKSKLLRRKGRAQHVSASDLVDFPSR
jgi:hypothetical protein